MYIKQLYTFMCVHMYLYIQNTIMWLLMVSERNGMRGEKMKFFCSIKHLKIIIRIIFCEMFVTTVS